MRKVCHGAISMMTLSIGDVIFSAGEMPAQPKMYIVCTGRLQYGTAGDFTKVMEAMWVAEAVMWTRWTHKGTLTAANDCRMCAFDAKKFMEICNEFDVEHHFFDPRHYAASFVEYLNSFPTAAVDDLTKMDVHRWLDFDDHDEDEKKSWANEDEKKRVSLHPSKSFAILKKSESSISRSAHSTMSVGWSPSNSLSNLVRSRKPKRSSGPSGRAPSYIAEESSRSHSEGNISNLEESSHSAERMSVQSFAVERMSPEITNPGLTKVNFVNSEVNYLAVDSINSAWEPGLGFQQEKSADAQAVMPLIPNAIVTVAPQERPEVLNMRPASALKFQEPPPEAVFIESHGRVRTPGPKPSPALAQGRPREHGFAERSSEICSPGDPRHNNEAFRDFREQASFGLPGPRYAADTPEVYPSAGFAPDSLEEFEV